MGRLSVDPNLFLFKKFRFRLFDSVSPRDVERLEQKIRDRQIRVGNSLAWLDSDLSLVVMSPPAVNCCVENFDLDTVPDLEVRELEY